LSSASPAPFPGPPAVPSARLVPAPAPAEAGQDPPRGSDYAQLARLIRQAGLLRRRPGYYSWKIAATALLLVAGWAGFVLVGDSWWTVAVAVFLAVIFAQMGFLGHDAGHKQISGSRRANYLLGVLHGNLGVGLSYGWWVDKHNRHHAHPNTEGADPDIHIGALAFSADQTRARGRLSRLMARYQAFFFFPLLLGEAIQLHAASIKAVITRTSKHGPAEIVLLAVHMISYLGIVLLVLSPVKAAVFIVIQQGLFGLYLGCSFAPNHKGMAMLSAGDRSDYLRRQVLTSRNVRGNWLTDLALGGLNYQIEHHLFPSMPRPNLRRSQDIVAAFCRQRGLSYTETSLIRSYVLAVRHLHEAGRPTLRPPAPAPAPARP
jgi:fatty acid desaturase